MTSKYRQIDFPFRIIHPVLEHLIGMTLRQACEESWEIQELCFGQGFTEYVELCYKVKDVPICYCSVNLQEPAPEKDMLDSTICDAHSFRYHDHLATHID